jgi:hypothetical protein
MILRDFETSGRFVAGGGKCEKSFLCDFAALREKKEQECSYGAFELAVGK